MKMSTIKKIINSKTDYEKKAVIPSYVLTCCFLLIHVILLVLFGIYKVTPMFYVNIFSILFYIGCFFLIRADHLRVFVLLSYLEISLHMVLAIFFIGWDAGFQITLIGILSIVFFAEYNTRLIDGRRIPGIQMGILLCIFYTGSYVVSRYVPAAYPLPEEVNFWLQIAWGVAVFSIDILFLDIFVQLAFRSEKYLESQVAHDPLTGLLTRYIMNDYLSKIINEQNRKQYWIAMIDIDDFKQINDTYGHNFGDYVLKTLADILRDNLNDAQVCRWGGEEFLVAGQSEKHFSVKERLEMLRKAVEDREFVYDEEVFHVTVTIGAARFGNDKTALSWLERADSKLYEGKKSGKNQVVF